MFGSDYASNNNNHHHNSFNLYSPFLTQKGEIFAGSYNCSLLAFVANLFPVGFPVPRPWRRFWNAFTKRVKTETDKHAVPGTCASSSDLHKWKNWTANVSTGSKSHPHPRFFQSKRNDSLLHRLGLVSPGYKTGLSCVYTLSIRAGNLDLLNVNARARVESWVTRLCEAVLFNMFLFSFSGSWWERMSTSPLQESAEDLHSGEFW